MPAIAALLYHWIAQGWFPASSSCYLNLLLATQQQWQPSSCRTQQQHCQMLTAHMSARHQRQRLIYSSSPCSAMLHSIKVQAQQEQAQLKPAAAAAAQA
jgi:hypothetical protein